MTDYDSMSVHDLVIAIANEGEFTGLTAKAHDDLTPLESALRKAVIREANGIAFHIENHETARNENGAWTEKRVNGHVEPRGSSFQMIPPGDYVLISKVTP